MAISLLDSTLYAGLVGDPELAVFLSDTAEIAAMVEAEIALAEVQGALGVIPQEAGRMIANALKGVVPAITEIAPGMAKDGVAAPALVAALRKHLPEAARDWLHFGATSQDIADLSLMLRLKRILDLLEARLDRIIAALAGLANAHRDTLCLARTRTQAASPTLFGLKCANWLQPFLRHRERLDQIRPRLLAVQCGGATGTLAAFGGDGLRVLDGLAEHLGLSAAEPWHTSRDRIEELASFLAMLASSSGRMGADMMLLASTDLGEISFAGAGGSSTLPQKQNPVIAEMLVALGRYAAGQVGLVHQSAIHPNERDGAAWTLEMLALGPLVLSAGSALARVLVALGGLKVDALRMRTNLEATNGMVLGEAATFALARHMPRLEAGAHVKAAIASASAEGRHLVDVLAERVEAPVDWEGLKSGSQGLESARALIDRVLAQA